MLKGNDYWILSIIIILGILIYPYLHTSNFVNYVAPYAPQSQKNWWKRSGWERFGFPSYSFWEGYENLNIRPAEINETQNTSFIHKKTTKESNILEFPPDSPAPAKLYNNIPYHLLEDEISPPRINETISCVNSRSCYATDFQRMIDKTGNYRQMTNNFKRGYPDSCSAPYQELVLNFYKADPVPIPYNNTGTSISESKN
jgi:hypothetical protein